MPDSEIKKRVSASKKLNKLCKQIDNGFFSAEVFWCRAAYDGYERWNFKMHRHSFFEMHFVLNGKISYSFDGFDEAVELTKGKYVVVAPDVSHHIENVEKGSSVFKLAFRINHPRHIAEHTAKNIPDFFESECDGFMSSSIEFMITQAMEEKMGFYDAVRCQLSAFAIYVLQSMPGVSSPAVQEESPVSDNDDRVRVVKQIINDNITGSLKSDDIARQVNISVRQLNRIIKHSDNMNLAEFIRHMRIEKAKKLLASSHDSLDAIAEKTGFISGSVLGRTFKAVEGCTPGQYRKDINT